MKILKRPPDLSRGQAETASRFQTAYFLFTFVNYFKLTYTCIFPSTQIFQKWMPVVYRNHVLIKVKSGYSKIIDVCAEHLDDLNHVNNVVYLQWVQDIAKEHWFSMAEKPFTEDHFWVVVKHELEYKKQAFLEDVIRATTFVESFRGPFSIRCVEFHRGEDLLVRTKSNWCLIDRKTGKPKRVPEEVGKLFQED